MRAVVRNLNEITDSREMFEAKAHPFITIFIAGLTVIIFAALVWSYFGEIDINVKASGVVRPNEMVSSVKNIVVGKVDKVNFKPGQKVKSGELLYSLEQSDLEVQSKALAKDLEKMKKDLTELNQFKGSLLENNNSSNDLSNTKNKNFFLENYTASQKIEVELIDLANQITKTNVTINNLQQLEKSILQKTNLFSQSDAENYSKYEDYLLKLQKIEAQKRKTVTDFKNSVGDIDLDAAKQQVEDMQLNVDDYANQYMLDIQTNLESNQKQLMDLQTSRDKIYLELNQTIQTDQDTIKGMQDKQEAFNANAQNYQIKAPADGIINSITEIKAGDLLQTGTEILSIVPENNSEYTVQMYLPNQDVANIKLGDKIKFQFQALPYKDYGELTGKVQLIGADAKVDQQSGGSYYLVEASIENRPLYNHKGEQGNIKVGMTCQAHVITSTKKILNYLLEKLDLKE
ncbi:MAG: hypothetical protein JWM44_2564 [Bacilli bacterium]|nr:hypothetical protein [Bacilli bacterium]